MRSIMKQRSGRKAVVRALACLIALNALAGGSGAVFGAEAAKAKSTSATRVELLAGKPEFLNWSNSQKEPRAMVLCLHELGFHKGVFEDLGRKMADDGYTVYSMDLRGFGDWHKVKGKEGRMDLDNTLADIKEAAEALHKKHPTLPLFILGEAMGGALALQAASEFPDLIQGTISSCPGGEHFKTTKNYLTVCKRLITTGPGKRFGYGRQLVSVATPRKELQTAFEEDPEVRLDLAPRELMACQFFMYKTKKFAKKIQGPVLIVQGQKDGESKPEGATKVYEKLASKDKTMLAVPEGDHYVYEDIKVDNDAYKRTVAWINERLSTGGAKVSQ
ncbi:MAG TPA: alpha/beta fold hydrolase [Candidatus Obscuribacterales bacterium]